MIGRSVFDQTLFEHLCAHVHNDWWREKSRQGFHAPISCPRLERPIHRKELDDARFVKRCEWCHPDMYSYDDLPEHVKEYDRVTVLSVLDALYQEGVDLSAVRGGE